MVDMFEEDLESNDDMPNSKFTFSKDDSSLKNKHIKGNFLLLFFFVKFRKFIKFQCFILTPSY